MTAFTTQNLTLDGAYIIFAGKAVARCKMGGAAGFASFMRKHFTVEEYFALADGGMAPLTILETKGYMLPHIKKWLKEAGLPTTREGYEEFVRRQIAASAARRSAS